MRALQQYPTPRTEPPAFRHGRSLPGSSRGARPVRTPSPGTRSESGGATGTTTSGTTTTSAQPASRARVPPPRLDGDQPRSMRGTAPHYAPEPPCSLGVTPDVRCPLPSCALIRGGRRSRGGSARVGVTRPVGRRYGSGLRGLFGRQHGWATGCVDSIGWRWCRPLDARSGRFRSRAYACRPKRVVMSSDPTPLYKSHDAIQN